MDVYTQQERHYKTAIETAYSGRVDLAITESIKNVAIFLLEIKNPKQKKPIEQKSLKQHARKGDNKVSSKTKYSKSEENDDDEQEIEAIAEEQIMRPFTNGRLLTTNGKKGIAQAVSQILGERRKLTTLALGQVRIDNILMNGNEWILVSQECRNGYIYSMHSNSVSILDGHQALSEENLPLLVNMFCRAFVTSICLLKKLKTTIVSICPQLTNEDIDENEPQEHGDGNSDGCNDDEEESLLHKKPDSKTVKGAIKQTRSGKDNGKKSNRSSGLGNIDPNARFVAEPVIVVPLSIYTKNNKILSFSSLQSPISMIESWKIDKSVQNHNNGMSSTKTLMIR